MLICNTNLVAQDGHYWTQQYGTRSMLLSGSMIGGVEDLGAVFYNPGRIALIENPAFLLSADVYEWNKFKITDAFGEGADVSSSDFGGVPTMMAGTFKIGFLENHQFAYSVLQRQSIDANIKYKSEVHADVIELFPGEEFFGASIQLSQRVQEDWYSLTWSHSFTPKFAAGIATNFVEYDQKKGNIIELQALSTARETAIYRFNRSFSNKLYGFIWKLGLAAELNKVHLGLTVTTPLVGVYGSGKYDYEEFYSGIPNQSDIADIYTTSNQDDLSIHVRKPWAVGLGATVLIKKSKIHFSSEWYSSVPYYVMMQSDEHISQSHGTTVDFTLVDDLQSLINFGIGLELYLNDRMSFYASASTDFSAAPENLTAFSQQQPIATNTVFGANYYHFGGGLVLKLKGVELTLGSTYTGGSQEFARPIDFPDEEDDNIFEFDETARLDWSRWRFVLGFSIPFFKDRVDDILENEGP